MQRAGCRELGLRSADAHSRRAWERRMMMLEACTAHAALVSSESNGCINLETLPQSPIKSCHRPFRAADRCGERTISREMPVIGRRATFVVLCLRERRISMH